MGKNKHSKDKIYKTVGELESRHVDSSRQYQLSDLHRHLKYDTCCLTLNSIAGNFLGICDADNYCHVFDHNVLIKFLDKHHVHPVTGKPMKDKTSLIYLKYHKNEEGKYHCPILLKPYNQYSKIVAYRKSGNVISHEAYQQLNVKKNNFRDLVTDEPIVKTDVLVIQDPELASIKLDVSNFYHVKEKLSLEDDQVSTINDSSQSSVFKSVMEEYKSKADAIAERYRTLFPAPIETRSDPQTLDKFNSANYSDGSVSRSVTSTIAPIETQVTPVELSEKQILYPRVKKKGYVQLMTNFGPLNLELFCDRTRETCYNFLLLSARGYYDGTIFHRLIKDFILQGGDPTGNGTGGTSAWNAPFKDEFHADLKHSGRGIVAMANSGPNTNKSQFYIVIRGSWPHLDGKHTVFGKLVGGEETLARIEHTEVDKKDRPKQEIKIEKVIIYVDPFKETKDAIEVERKKELEMKRSLELGSDNLAVKKFRSGVGTYINLDGRDSSASSSSNGDKLIINKESKSEKPLFLKPKSVQTSKPFINFSNW